MRVWCGRELLFPAGGVARGDEAGFVGEHDGVDPVAQVELAQDALDVRFDGGLAEDQLAGDLWV